MRIDRVKFAAELARSGLRVYELAERAGVSRGTITAVRNGKSCAHGTAIKLAACLGVDVEELREIQPFRTMEQEIRANGARAGSLEEFL